MSAKVSASPLTSAVRVAEPPARFRDLLAAEWIKMRSLRSTPWTLGLITLFVIGSATLAAMADYNNFPRYSPESQREHMFSLHDAFPSTGYWTLTLVAVSMGAIAVVSEYGSGLIRTTIVAVPARGAVVLAKAVVVAAVWAVVGAVSASGSFAVSQAILAGRDAAISITDPGAFRAMVASALVAPVCALIGLGLGFLIRHTAATTAAGIFTLLVLPAFFSTSRRWSAELNHSMVLTAWQRLSTEWLPPSRPGYYVATITESWIVYAVWPLVAIVVALVVIRRRDV
ncbi:hypothetical protein ABZ807_29945 [Micromonospora sp. NPDC047548]|uniref:hypothetical protein n=1 Tax=Micromonospora sp. NPDC047548 TaxID=3155624 RepID=UPI0033DA1F75